MFLPDNLFQNESSRKEIRASCKHVEELSLSLIPPNFRQGVQVTAQEIQCGDPNCSPIDTTITIIFNSGGRGMLGLPMEAKEVTMEELKNVFPPPAILAKWHAGQEAEWPPEPEWDDDDDYDAVPLNDDAVPLNAPSLRFGIGQKVLCRIGTNQWAPGEITQLWYREASWPPTSWAPYKVKLDDGRDIFAPGDLDQVIKANPAYA